MSFFSSISLGPYRASRSVASAWVRPSGDDPSRFSTSGTGRDFRSSFASGTGPGFDPGARPRAPVFPNGAHAVLPSAAAVASARCPGRRPPVTPGHSPCPAARTQPRSLAKSHDGEPAEGPSHPAPCRHGRPGAPLRRQARRKPGGAETEATPAPVSGGRSGPAPATGVVARHRPHRRKRHRRRCACCWREPAEPLIDAHQAFPRVTRLRHQGLERRSSGDCPGTNHAQAIRPAALLTIPSAGRSR